MIPMTAVHHISVEHAIMQTSQANSISRSLPVPQEEGDDQYSAW